MSPHRKVATYSLLGARDAPPSEYEVVSSRLHYYVGRGFETDVPLRHWYERYQRGSALQCPDWDAFVDPEETTYRKYTSSRMPAELELDRLVASLEAQGGRPVPPSAWTATLGAILPPLRYALHGMHMIASYIGHMAPSGRITLAALFQSADELRRIERIALGMRMAQERQAREFGASSKAEWQSGAAWQPLRQATELLLVAYDWGESLVGLNLCLKPVIDELAMGCLQAECERHGEPYWAAALERAHADCLWQRRWTTALVRLALAQNPENREVIRRWLELWEPRALSAAEPLAALLPDPAAACARVRAFHADYVAGALSARDRRNT